MPLKMSDALNSFFTIISSFYQRSILQQDCIEDVLSLIRSHGQVLENLPTIYIPVSVTVKNSFPHKQLLLKYHNNEPYFRILSKRIPLTEMYSF